MKKINGMTFVNKEEAKNWLTDPKQHSEYTTKAAHLEYQGEKLYPCQGIVAYMVQHPKPSLILLH